MKRVELIATISLFSVSCAIANQPMQTDEIFQLFERLCQQQADGWIQRGHIEAIHHFSDSATNQTIQTHETVKTDGSRFAWRIRMTSDNGSAKPKKKDSKNFLQWNQDRMFTWDGQTYTLYFRPGNHAIVHEFPSAIPVNVSGPLTAGHIPWGQGIFTYENLSEIPVSATRIQTENGLQVQLTLTPVNHPQMQFLLDPEKDHAVLSYTLNTSDQSRIVQIYGNFIEQQGRWVPMNIIIDRYENNCLTSSDVWEITFLDDMVPQDDSFSVPFQDKALVEYYIPDHEKPAFYRHLKGRDIESLRDKRFVAAIKRQARQKQNCATVAVEHILSEFGIMANDDDLASLVDTVSGDTSLYQIQQFIERNGLSCLPVKTNMKGLNRFSDSKVILHWPEKKHFVILDRIEKDKVWLIDLDRQTFYHFMDISRFTSKWAGIALVVSEQPLSLGNIDKPVPVAVLRKIAGSADYSCSDLIQEYDVSFCPDMVKGNCGGRYIMWYDRYGCQVDAEGGYCDGTGVVGSVYSSCIVDTANPGQCTTTGDYISRTMRACQP